MHGEGAGDFFGGAIAMSAAGTTVAVGALFNDGEAEAGPFGCVACQGHVSTAGIRTIARQRIPTHARARPAHTHRRHSLQRQVRVFDWNPALQSWEQRGEDIDGVRTEDNSGSALAMSAAGDVVAIGAPRWPSAAVGDPQRGSVRAYAWDSASSSWLQRGEMIRGEADGDISGSRLAMSALGTTIAIGA